MSSFSDKNIILWNAFTEKFAQALNSTTFMKTYVKGTSVQFYDEKNVVLLCENNLSKRFFDVHYELVSSIFTEILGSERSLIFSTDKIEKPKNYLEESDSNSKNSSDYTIIKSNFQSNLNSKYTFDRFIRTNCNMRALAVAQQVVKDPGKIYNPLFIYGNSGLGKTHLLHAIGNEIIRRDPSKKVLYVPTETFTTDYISSIQENKMNDFRSKYRTVDVLLIDDIQFIAKKIGTQEEFFNTFNELYSKDKQIVISSDCRIAEINDLADRLKTRFEHGITTAITIPEYEDRRAIMEGKIVNMDLNVSKEMIDYLAAPEISNIREIEGILNSLMHVTSEGGKITNDVINEIFKNLNLEGVKEVDFGLILDVVSRYFHIKIEDITSKNRTKNVVVARHAVMYMCKTILGYNYSKIAELFGGMDHTTVSDGCKRVEKKYHTDEDVKAYIDEIKKLIEK